MNFFKAAYCRIFQAAERMLLPLLPYRDPKIISSTDEIRKVLEERGKVKPLLVTGARIRSLNLSQPLEKGLKDCAVYDKIVANPTTQTVEEGVEIYKAEGCDCIIAFGGGSPMDCAKAIGARIVTNKSMNRLAGVLKVRKKLPLLIAVPTTAGTGSETSPAAVIVDSVTRHKYAVSDFSLIPDYAVLDSSLLSCLPAKVKYDTGMDALTHAVEAYVGRGGNRAAKRDALEAVKLIFENIEEYATNGKGSDNMMIASHLAGRAFSKSYVGYVHALAHPIGGKYDVAHGFANAVILPVVLREYGRAAYKKLYKIAVYCGMSEDNKDYAAGAEKVIAKIEQLNGKFGVPQNIEEIREEDIPELAKYADKEANPLYPVPKLWGRRKLEEVYRKINGAAH